MPLFRVKGSAVTQVAATTFTLERDLQRLFEANLDVIFGCRLVASEFATGDRHGGRIDTLALSEDGNPVIIEYKKEPSSDLLNQSLFYLSWIQDHKGDFEIACQRALGTTTTVDWSDTRVICIAPGFKKYDLHAVNLMGANIELWQYRLFEDGSLFLDELYRRLGSPVRSLRLADPASPALAKNPVMVEAGYKAAQTRLSGVYAIDDFKEKASEYGLLELMEALREKVFALSESIEEVPKKLYVAYKVAKNFMCFELRKGKLLLFLKVDPATLTPMPTNARDVSNIGHYGTGDLELSVKNIEELENAMPLIAKALDNVGE